MFKPGDRVICIDASYSGINLLLNKSYTIVDYFPPGTLTVELVILENTDLRVKANRFKLDFDYYRRIKINKIKERINYGNVR